MRDGVRALRVRNFRLYFGAFAMSQIGNWVQIVALTILVLRLTDDGFAIGLVNAARFGPFLLLGPWAGVLSDRSDRWRVVVATQIFGGVIAASLTALVAIGWTPLVLIYVLAVAGGIEQAVEMPSRKAMISDIVAADQVSSAVGLASAMNTAAKVIGPAIAGALVVGPGLAFCFAVNACSYVAMVLFFSRMDRTTMASEQTVTRMRGQIREGLRYAWQNQELRLPLLMVSAVGTLAFNFQVVLPLFAVRDLAGTESTFTMLFAIMSVGSMAGAFVIAARREVSIRTIAWSVGAMGVTTFAFAASPSILAASLLIVPVGAASVVVMAGAQATIQLRAEPAMRGRVLALLAMLFVGTTPIGAPLLGWVSERFGARAALGVGGATCLILWLYMLTQLGIRSRPRTAPASEAA